MRRIGRILAVLAGSALVLSVAQSFGFGASGPGRTVASGVTKIAQWELYVHSPSPGRRCLGMRVRSLWGESGTVSRERCAARRIAGDAVTLQSFAPEGLGAFAYGRAGRTVEQVEVRVGDRAPVRVATVRGPPGSRGRLWAFHAGDACTPVSVQALARGTDLPGKRRSGRIGPPRCG